MSSHRTLPGLFVRDLKKILLWPAARDRTPRRPGRRLLCSSARQQCARPFRQGQFHLAVLKQSIRRVRVRFGSIPLFRARGGHFRSTQTADISSGRLAGLFRARIGVCQFCYGPSARKVRGSMPVNGEPRTARPKAGPGCWASRTGILERDIISAPADIRLGRAAARLLPPEWLRAACNNPRDLCSHRASSPRTGTSGGSCARRCARCLCP